MKVEIEYPIGLLTYQGKFIIDALTYGAEQGAFVTLGISAQSDGEVFGTWLVTP